MSHMIGRRGFLGATGALAAGMAVTDTAKAEVPARYQEGVSPFPLIMNTSTIRPASLEDKIRVSKEAGYDGLELWIGDLEKHEADGGSLEDLGKSIRDQGMFVHNIIGLWNCMPEGEEALEESLTGTRERMRRTAAVGSKHVAAIPAPDRENFDLAWGTHCYKRLLDIGRDEFDIIVAFEFIGFLKGVHRLGQACAIALDVNDPDACLVADTFHLWRGDSGFNGIQHLNGKFIGNFHFNDVPGDTVRDGAGDDVRVFPGDGDLPLGQLLRDLVKIGYMGPLSLECFNRDHWEMDAGDVAREGIDKARAVIADAGV